MTRFRIEYVGRRAFLAGARAGLDIEDQPWIVAQGESVVGTEAQADEHAEALNAETDGAFVHRAVAVPSEPEDQIALPEPVKTVAPVAARRAS